MSAGFDLGTTTTSALRVKTTGFEQRPFAWSCFGRAVFAEAKTSAGAPCWICAASWVDPPEEERSDLSLLGNVSVSDEAAYTVSCVRATAPAGARSAAATSARTVRR